MPTATATKPARKTTTRKAPVKAAVTTWDTDATLEESAAPIIRLYAANAKKTRDKDAKAILVDMAEAMEHNTLRWAHATATTEQAVKGAWYIAVDRGRAGWDMVSIDGAFFRATTAKVRSFTLYAD